MKSLSPASYVKWATFLYILSVLPSLCSGGRRRGRTQRSDVSGTDILKTGIHRSYSSTDDVGSDDNELGVAVGNDVPNMSTNEEENDLYRQQQIDPKGSWLSFVKYSDDRLSDNTPDRRKKKRNKKKKNRNKKLHGPPGPVGPPGPPGLPGFSISKAEILEDLRSLIQEYTDE